MWSEPFVSRWRTMTWFLGPNGKIHLPQAVLTIMDQGQHWKIATSVSHTSRAGKITREEGRGGEKWRAEVCVLLCFLWSNLISSFAVSGEKCGNCPHQFKTSCCSSSFSSLWMADRLGSFHSLCSHANENVTVHHFTCKYNSIWSHWKS